MRARTWLHKFNAFEHKYNADAKVSARQQCVYESRYHEVA